jgi:putative peptide zinc metalloprotease protein
VVVPENISAAVNYSCQDCVTYALASQLVVTMPDGLSADAKARITTLWQEIERFGQRIRGLSAQQIQAQLEQYKAEIVAILRADGAVPSPGPAPTTSAPESPPATVPSVPAPTGTTPSGPAPTPSTVPAAPAPPAPDVTSPEPTAEPTQSASPEQSPSP